MKGKIMTLAKLDVLTSMIAACLEITSVGLAFNSFILLLPDMFIVANSSNDPYHHAEQLPYAQVFSCVSGVILGNAALLDIWHPLVRGHGSGVSKYVSVPVSIMKVVSVIVVVAWAVSSIILSSFFTEAVFPNSSPNLCELSQDQCSAASAVAVEACTTVVLVIVSVVAHCCGSCRFCPGNRKKFTNVMIQSSKGPFKNFGWLGALVLGLAGMATQLLLAWLATANDLDVNASEAQDSWTDIPWVVRGISLGSAAMVLFATLCDIMAVALATDRVQKLATNRVETISTVLKICSLIASVICAICVTLDYTKWSAKACVEKKSDCQNAASATMLSWVSALLVNIYLVGSCLHQQHINFLTKTEAMGIHHLHPHDMDINTQNMYSELNDDAILDDMDEDEGNMILNNASISDPSSDIITVGADGRIYTGGTV